MSSKMKLSIIIPHYNSPQYLQILLASIPVISDIQVIVVDDKSTERIEEYEKLRETYSGKNIEFYNNDGIKSAGTCRNIGIRHAIGEWLLFADADDYFMDGFYDIVSCYLSSDYDIVFFPPTSVVMGTKELSDRHLVMAGKVQNYYENPDHKNELALRYRVMGPVSKLIRRTLVLTNEIWFEEILASNDVMFSAQCGYAAKKITVDTHVIYCITKHRGSLTAQWKEDVLETRLWACLRHFSFLKQHLSKEDMDVLHMNENGRNMLLQTLQKGYPLGKLFRAIREYRKCGVKIWEQDLLTKPWHCLHVIYDNLCIRKQNKKKRLKQV